MHKTITASVVLGLVLGLSSAQGSTPTVCALIKSGTSEEIATGAQELLEQKLLAEADIQLVERPSINRILGELALSASQGNVNFKQRLQLGKLLKADILVFLSEWQKGENTAVSVRVAESETGLQLGAETCLWEKKNAEATVTSLFEAVKSGIARHKAGFQVVLAIPPLECADRSPAQACWRRPLATLLQERFLKQKGILVVELEEARAFATEFFIGKEPARLKHSLPLFLLGQYTTHTTDEDLFFSFDLRLKQGGKEVVHQTAENIRQNAVLEKLSNLVAAIAGKLEGDGHSAAPADPAAEARLLTNRAELFNKLGEYDVALLLYETLALIDPANVDTHVQILAMVTVCANREFHKYVMATWIGKEVGADNLDLWVAERGIEHMEYLCRHAPFSAAVQHALFIFRAHLTVLCYWAPEGSPDYRSRVMQFLRRRQSSCLHYISRLQHEKRLYSAAGSFLIPYYGWMAGDMVRSDPAAAIDSMWQLLRTLRAEDKVTVFLINAVTYLGVQMDQFAPIYGSFLDELEASDKSDWKVAGKLGRICYGIYNPETREKGLAAIQALDQWKTFDPWQRHWIESAVELCMTMRGHRVRAFVPKTEPVFVPRLAPLSVNLEGSDTLTDREVHDWANCEKHGDCIATDSGIFLLDGQASRKISQRVAYRLGWDGRWIWAITEKAVVAIEPQTGSEVTFPAGDLGGIVSSSHLLCPIEQGQIAVVGYLFGVQRALRTWVSLLTIAEASSGITKKAQVIYDAREQHPFDPAKVDEKQSVREGFLAQWALACKQGPTESVSTLMIGRGENRHVQPLLIKLKDHSASILQTTWPGALEDTRHDMHPYVIRHAGAFYIALGESIEPQVWSGIFRTTSLDTTPELFANFGIRPSNQFFLCGKPFFCGGAVHNNVLHLLTQYSDMQPHWVAADLGTGQTSVLATTLPAPYWSEDEFGGSSVQLPGFRWPTGNWDWAEHRLIASNKHGLVLLARGKAYAVTLPDQSTWPPFPKTPTKATLLKFWPPPKEK